MAISRDVGDFGAVCGRNRPSRGRPRSLRGAAASGIGAKSGSLLLRRDVFSAHVCARVACPTPAITTAVRRISPPTYRATGGLARLDGPCNPLGIFGPATSLPRRKAGFFAVRYKKIAFSPRPRMTRLECVVARAYQPRSRIRVSLPLSLSLALLLSLSFSFFRISSSVYISRLVRVTMNLCVVVDKKKKGKKERTFLRMCESPSREILFVDRNRARARCPFPSFARLSRIADWIVIGYNRHYAHIHTYIRVCTYTSSSLPSLLLCPEIFVGSLSFPTAPRHYKRYDSPVAIYSAAAINDCNGGSARARARVFFR